MPYRLISALTVAVLVMAAPVAHAQTTSAYPSSPRDSAVSVPVPGAGGSVRAGSGGTTGFPAAAPSIPFVDLTIRSPKSNQEVAFSVQLLLLLTVLSLAPSILILVTSFLRISIVLNFIKSALSLQQVPPNQVLMGIAFFMTIFVMWPTLDQVNREALTPLVEGKVNLTEAYKAGEAPLRLFMYRQMESRPENIRLFMSMRGLPKPNTLADVPTYILVPAFILNELTVAFKIGIYLYIPFIIIDMVVASVLMSMGMIMLPPVMISMPFKLILFVLVDGWGLMTQQLVRSFR
jgi:flagellar biosynthetic protein FliP